MGPGRIPVFVLVLASLPSACRTPDPGEEFRSEPDEYGYRESSPRREESYGDGVSGSPGRIEPVESGTRVVLGAWAFDGRVKGHAEGAPTDFHADTSAIPGYSFEMRFLARDEDPERWGSMGLLLEHFRDSEDHGVPGGTARAEGALTAIFGTLGVAYDPYRDGSEIPADFGSRFDVLLGFRRGFSQVEVPDGAGGTYRKGSTWGELAAGVRAEWSPVRRLFLFARFDGGAELAPDNAAEEEGGSDSSLGAVSYQIQAGVRVRALDHLSLLLGWRFTRMDGREIVNGGTDEVQTARTTWTGLWAGIELDF